MKINLLDKDLLREYLKSEDDEKKRLAQELLLVRPIVEYAYEIYESAEKKDPGLGQELMEEMILHIDDIELSLKD